MTPIQSMMKSCIKKYQKNKISILADWCEEREMIAASKEMRKGCTKETLDHLRALYFAFFGEKFTQNFWVWCDKKTRKSRRNQITERIVKKRWGDDYSSDARLTLDEDIE